MPPEEEWDSHGVASDNLGRVYIDGIRYDRMSELPRDISPEARNDFRRRQELFNAQFFNEWNVEKVEKEARERRRQERLAKADEQERLAQMKKEEKIKKKMGKSRKSSNRGGYSS